MSLESDFYKRMTKPHIEKITVGFAGIDPTTDFKSEEFRALIKEQVQECVQDYLKDNFNFDQDTWEKILKFINGKNVVIDCNSRVDCDDDA